VNKRLLPFEQVELLVHPHCHPHRRWVPLLQMGQAQGARQAA